MTSGSGGYARVRTGIVWLVAEVRYRHPAWKRRLRGRPLRLASLGGKLDRSLWKARPRLYHTWLIVQNDDAYADRGL